MKKILSTLLAFVMLATTLMAVPFSAQAEVKYPEASGTLLSGQTFTYDSITETLTISGEGAITGYNWTGDNVSPFQYCTVKHIVIEEGITSLCNYLFHTVYGIESFSIPASLKTIAYYAINYCTFVGGAGKGFIVAAVIPSKPENTASPSSTNSNANTASPTKKASATTKISKPKKTSIKKTKKGKKSLSFTLKKVSGVSGYQVQTATDKKFKKGRKTVTSKKTNVTFKKLKSKKKYYVRVRTYKTVKGKKYYSDWSKTKSVKTK